MKFLLKMLLQAPAVVLVFQGLENAGLGTVGQIAVGILVLVIYDAAERHLSSQ